MFDDGSMHLVRNSVGMEIWDNGEMYVRNIYTESGTDSSGYMGFVKTFLATVDNLRAINYIGGVTSAGSRGLNVSTYAENFDIFAATSDEQLKKDIADSQVKALDVIKKIRLISFCWKDTGKYQAMGFSAQQLQGICEDFVSSVKQPEGSEYDEILQVRDFNMLPYVIGAVQELAEENRELKKQLEKQQGQINLILSRLEGKNE